jgi:hypothetical protein
MEEQGEVGVRSEESDVRGLFLDKGRDRTAPSVVVRKKERQSSVLAGAWPEPIGDSHS